MPIFYKIKNTYPKANIILLTNSPDPNNKKQTLSHSILEGTDLIDSVITYQLHGMKIEGWINLFKILKSFNFDILFYLMPKRSLFQLLRDYYFFSFIGIKTIIGFNFSGALSKSYLKLKKVVNKHEIQRLISNLDQLGEIDYLNPKFLSMNLKKSELDEALNLLSFFNGKPFLAISIGAKDDVKNWSLNKWLTLLNKISEKYNQYGIVFIGSSDEYELCNKLISPNKNLRTLNLCGLTSVRLSAAVIKFSQLFIGHDSGPMHLAASVETKIIAIFSARSLPGEWYPLSKNSRVIYHKTRCYGCNLSTCIKYEKECIESISVNEVFEEIEMALD